MTAISEAELWGRVPMPDLGTGERFRVRVERCACWGEIVATTDPASWTEAVARHQATAGHVLWWLRQCCEGER